MPLVPGALSLKPAIRLFLLLIVATVGATDSRPRLYRAMGEVELAHITPEQARAKARQQAFAEMISEASGVRISSKVMLINSRLASYDLVQTQDARVVNAHCNYPLKELKLSSGTRYIQQADCRGEVQRFGTPAPTISAALLPLPENAQRCRFDPQTLADHSPDIPTWQAGERFCLVLRSAQQAWVGAFGLFEQQGKTRINRVYPKPGSGRSALQLTPGKIPELTALSSAPLAGQKQASEALLLVVSSRPELMDQLVGAAVGSSVQETVENSVPMHRFDQQLGRLDLKRIDIRILPYLVRDNGLDLRSGHLTVKP